MKRSHKVCLQCLPPVRCHFLILKIFNVHCGLPFCYRQAPKNTISASSVLLYGMEVHLYFFALFRTACTSSRTTWIMYTTWGSSSSETRLCDIQPSVTTSGPPSSTWLQRRGGGKWLTGWYCLFVLLSCGQYIMTILPV